MDKEATAKKEVKSMSEKEIVKSVTEAVSALPEEKREYILGYAEGVLAMADRVRCKDSLPAGQPSA